MPRSRLLHKVLVGKKAPLPVVPNAKDTGKIAEKKPFQPPKPESYSLHAQKLHLQARDAVREGKPHFQIGGKEVYLPFAPVTLLKPSAKMTPYQAQFQVPRNFNKLDLRDYLWHLYGLRALNITTQIKWSEWVRGRASRYRTSQVKKMIIDMEQPFVWPARDVDAENSYGKEYTEEFDNYREEMQERLGSDLKKPAKAFDGLLGPYPEPPQAYVPEAVKAKMVNAKAKAERQQKRKEELHLIQRLQELRS